MYCGLIPMDFTAAGAIDNDFSAVGCEKTVTRLFGSVRHNVREVEVVNLVAALHSSNAAAYLVHWQCFVKDLFGGSWESGSWCCFAVAIDPGFGYFSYRQIVDHIAQLWTEGEE